MSYFFQELNKDQLNGLSQLCLDLAKGAFAFLLIPSAIVPENPLIALLKISFVLVAGIAFIYIALLLLRLKEKVKE